MRLPFLLNATISTPLRRLLSVSPISPQLSRTAAKPKISKEKATPGNGCPVCREGLQYFGYRDVLLLRQFLTPSGLILGRRETKVCPKLQRRVARCIKRARKEGLLPNFEAAPSAVTK